MYGVVVKQPDGRIVLDGLFDDEDTAAMYAKCHANLGREARVFFCTETFRGLTMDEILKGQFHSVVKEVPE